MGGPQDISIGGGCEYIGVVMHEMFHALGRWHEQSRPDRDQFVRINFNNIQEGTTHLINDTLALNNYNLVTRLRFGVILR